MASKYKFKHQCRRESCKYSWESNLENPKQCPKCKRYDWNIDKSKKIK